MFHVPNKYRIRGCSLLSSDDSFGNNGAFLVPLNIENNINAQVIVSDGEGWEHVSVVIIDNRMPETPTWDEMCIIKDMFWDEEDTVVQYHPPKSEYINNNENCLHLWRKIGFDFPLPDSTLIGIKK